MTRTAYVVDIPVLATLEKGAGKMSVQLAHALRTAVRNGDICPGDVMPSTRQLAAALSVARGTVVEAYEQLISEGFFEASAGSKTRVATTLCGSSFPGIQGVSELTATRSLPQPAARFAQIGKEFAPLPSVPFAISVPGPLTAPSDTWRRIGNRLRGKGPAAPAGYADPKGELTLRKSIVDYVRRARSVRCEADQVIITSGTQQGLFIACTVLLGPGDQGWVENPAYRGLTAILESTGQGDTMIRVPVDADGIDVEAGIRVAPNARVAFVTPSHQYPLGAPMSMARRNALLAWAGANDAWIVEDDYDSELRYEGYPFPSLQGLSPQRVVYLGTFSKVLFPSLRLGYIIVPDDLVDAFCGARVLMDRHPPNADQHVLATFISEGHFERHIRRIRAVYGEQRARLVDIFDAFLPRRMGWVQSSDQGMHLVLWLGNAMDDRQIAALAAQAKIVVKPLSPMFAPNTERPGLILGFGGFSSAEMEVAARQLITIIKDAFAR